MTDIHTMLTNCRTAYEAMTDEELIKAMDDHMHLDVDPSEDGLLDEAGELDDRDDAVEALLRADERELRLLGY